MANLAQRSFASGEIAPSLFARTDQVKYATGLRTCRNFMVMRHGGVTNRPGTQFADTTKSSAAVRLVKFVFNAAQTYVLEFGHLYVRFYQSGARIAYEIASPYAIGELWDLKFVQSADVITVVHLDHPPYELRRLGHTSWTLTAADFSNPIDPPTELVVWDAVGNGAWLKVTTIDAETGSESLPSAAQEYEYDGAIGPNPQLMWTAVPGASFYNVYMSVGDDDQGSFGFVASVTAPRYNIVQQAAPDYLNAPPVAREPFSSEDNYPSAVGYYQQRQCFASTRAAPTAVWTSRSADYLNLGISTPLQDDDAVTFSLVGRQVNGVQHLLDLGRLVLFTDAGEWVIAGDAAGILRPGEINPRQYSYNGAHRLSPVIINDTAIYVQARGTILRDLASDVSTEGFKGSDLTIFSAHLFDGYSIVDLDYQQIPQSVIWVVRSDGALLGLTYVKEQQLWGWHRHDTDGFVENVCVVPEGNEDRVYLVVRRVINGQTKRYVERMASRFFSDIADAFFVDSGLSYDGRDAGAESGITMTLSGGTEWDSAETLTISASDDFFGSDDVGNAIFLHADDGAVVRFMLRAYTSPSVMTGRATTTVPTAARSTPIAEWDYAVDVVGGLEHLNGKAVSVLADGFVVSSPNNTSITSKTVSGGGVTLDRPYACIHVGLPYICDFETLDLDTAEGSSLKEKKMLVNRVGLYVEKTRGLFVGARAPESDATDALDGLSEAQMRDSHPLFVESFDDPIALLTDVMTVDIERSWDSNGRVFARQVDPLPATILSAIPQGKIPRT